MSFGLLKRRVCSDVSVLYRCVIWVSIFGVNEVGGGGSVRDRVMRIVLVFVSVFFDEGGVG